MDGFYSTKHTYMALTRELFTTTLVPHHISCMFQSTPMVDSQEHVASSPSRSFFPTQFFQGASRKYLDKRASDRHGRPVRAPIALHLMPARHTNSKPNQTKQALSVHLSRNKATSFVALADWALFYHLTGKRQHLFRSHLCAQPCVESTGGNFDNHHLSIWKQK